MNELRFHWPQLQGVGESILLSNEILGGSYYSNLIPKQRVFCLGRGNIFTMRRNFIFNKSIGAPLASEIRIRPCMGRFCFWGWKGINRFLFPRWLWPESTSMRRANQKYAKCIWDTGWMLWTPQIDKFKMRIHFQLQKCLIWQKYSIIKQWKTCYAFC